MAGSALNATIECEAETAFCEVTNTYSLRPPVIGTVDCSGLVHESIDSQRATQRYQEMTPYITMTQGGTFKTKMYLFGHGSTAIGAFTVSAIETLLGDIFGGVTASASASTTASGGTASALTVAASGTYAAGAGGGFRLGVAGDGRGNGQLGIVASHVTTTLTSLTAFDNAPSGTDAVSSAANVYLLENPSNTAPKSYRFRLNTFNGRYECHGCVPTEVKIDGTNPGAAPTIEITWTVSAWNESTATFPSAVAGNTSNPAPAVAGSLLFQDVGSAARVKLTTVRAFSVDIKLGVVMLEGVGGNFAWQKYVGAVRTGATVTVNFTIDMDNNTATSVLGTAWLNRTPKQVLYTLSITDGSTVGFYFPQVFPSGNRPVQKTENNVARYSFSGMAGTGPTTTTDLTASAFRIILA